MAEYVSPGSRAFRKYKALMKNCICDISSIATQLYSEGVISKSTEKEVIHGVYKQDDRCSILLDAVEKRISSSKESFDIFMNILSREPVHREIVSKVQAERGEFTNSHEQFPCIPYFYILPLSP